MANNEQRKYNITCPYCGKKQSCYPSIFHRMGLCDMGSGNCSNCNKHMQIIYDIKTYSMNTRKWEEFEKEIKK
ncbi:MAG: hypothetical protein ACI4TT_03690 [Christensenellales bacterium]